MSPLEQLLEDTAQPFGQQQGKKLPAIATTIIRLHKTSRI